MAFPWIAAAGAAISVISNGSQRNAAVLQNAERYGIDTANKAYRTNTALAAGKENMRTAQANAISSTNAAVLKTQSQDSQRTVAQAMTGVEGGSAEMTQRQADRNADITQAQVTSANNNIEDRIRTQTADTMVGIQTQLSGDSPQEGTVNTALLGALAGLANYGQNTGFE